MITKTIYTPHRSRKVVVANMLSGNGLGDAVIVRGYRISDWAELLPGGAVLLSDENVIVVADLHLGCEAALEYEGLSIPRVQTKKIMEYMESVIREIGPNSVVVAGDLKHNFSRNLMQEWRDVRTFVSELANRTPVRVVKGNHDNFLNLILRECGAPPMKSELRIGNITVVHGHKSATERGSIVMGHIHPSLTLRDSASVSVKDRCFLWNPEKQLLVLPALSLVAAGVDVIASPDADAMSPLLSAGGLPECLPIVFAGEKALKFPSIGDLRRSN